MLDLLPKFYSPKNLYLKKDTTSQLDHYTIFKEQLFPAIDKRLIKSIPTPKNQITEAQYKALLNKLLSSSKIKEYMYGSKQQELKQLQRNFVFRYALENYIPIHPNYLFPEENSFGNYVYNLIINKKLNSLLEVHKGQINKYLLLASRYTKAKHTLLTNPKDELPKLKSQHDLIYICGYNTFDNSMLLFHYSDLVLKRHGYIVLDNTDLPAIFDLREYLDSNYIHYERVETTYKSFYVYKKLKEDPRSRKFHIKFTK